MNVRFFGGTKSEYLDIAKHNPTALYFCADTRELFWGDRLLSDGIRLVRTKEDLPALTAAADGIIYYVVESRAGYVLLPDRTGWLNIFSTPVTDIGNVSDKEAGVTAVSVLALHKLENDIYEKIGSVEQSLKNYIDKQVGSIEKTDLTGYATEEFVKTQILEARLDGKDIDLSAYYTKTDVDKLIANFVNKEDLPKVPTKVGELENDAGYITAADVEKTDLSGYYDKTEIDNLVADAINKINIPEMPDLGEYAKLSDIPSHDDLATKDSLQDVVNELEAITVSSTKDRYEVIMVPGLEVTYRDDEIRINTEHIELTPQNVGAGGESNAYYVGIKIYAPTKAEKVRQNITSTPGIQEGKEIVSFTQDDVDEYGRKYSNAWVKCAINQNGAWTNYGLSSTTDKCLGYYYTVEWFDLNGNIIENDSIHVVFTNDTCHYSNISDAVSRGFMNIKQNYVTNEYIQTQNFVTNNFIEQNYITTEQIAATYVTEDKVAEVVTNEVNTVVVDKIETTVTEVIQEKVEAGEINVTADAITYGDF